MRNKLKFWLAAAMAFISFASLAVSPALAADPASADSGAGNSTSYNWSGYVANNGTYAAVGATWAVPQGSFIQNQLAADAAWVGIGGVGHSDLIQAGTQTMNDPTTGAISYQAWYETLPQNEIPVPLTVHAGDSVTVSVGQASGNQWNISFVNNTTGQTYQVPVTYASSYSSAEWIEEMPTSNLGLVPLDDFGTVQFSNGWTVKNGQNMNISQAGAQSLSMVDSYQQILASPSGLSYDGSGFSVSRTTTPAVSTQTATQPFGEWGRTGVSVETKIPQITVPQPVIPQVVFPQTTQVTLPRHKKTRSVHFFVPTNAFSFQISFVR